MEAGYAEIWHQLMLLAISAGLGALIGLERERADSKIAGFRTFTLITVFGSVAALVAETAGGWVIAAGLIGVVTYLISGRFNPDETLTDRGRTTEIASLVAYGIGVLVWLEHLELALTLGIGTTWLLYFKPELHGVVEALERKDYIAILQFTLISFVILPVLPNQGYGPWGVFNPHRIWLMVVLVAGISLAGYVAFKAFGSRAGAPLSGLLGGSVSSTATSISFGRLSREWEVSPMLPAVTILVANATVYLRTLAELAVINRELASRLYLPLGILFALGIAMAALYWFLAPGKEEEREKFQEAERALVEEEAGGEGTEGAEETDEVGEQQLQQEALPEIKNPTALPAALQFGALFALIVYLVAVVQNYFQGQGMTILVLASSIVDLDAIVLSMAESTRQGQMAGARAAQLVVIGTLSNLFFNFLFVAWFNRGKLLRYLAYSLLVLGSGTVAVLLWMV